VAWGNLRFQSDSEPPNEIKAKIVVLLHNFNLGKRISISYDKAELWVFTKNGLTPVQDMLPFGLLQKQGGRLRTLNLSIITSNDY